jgi:hypothetical protein
MSFKNSNVIASGFAAIGLCTAVALVAFGNTNDLNHTYVNETGLIIVATVSAGFSGFAFSQFFGRAGQAGWFFAGIGAVTGTVMGAAIAGTVIQPIFGTIIAPLILVSEAIINPPIFIFWLALMAGLHVVALKTKS